MSSYYNDDMTDAMPETDAETYDQDEYTTNTAVDDNVTDTPSESRPNPKKNSLPEETISDLKEFIHLCEQIKAASEEVKVLKDRKSELEGNISEFMIKNGIQHFETPNGKISVIQSKTMKPLNKEYLRDTISARIADRSIVDELTDLAFAKRPSTSVQKIKVTRMSSK